MTEQQVVRIASNYADSLRIICQCLVDHGMLPPKAKECAPAIVKALGRNDPPLLICSEDEVKDD